MNSGTTQLGWLIAGLIAVTGLPGVSVAARAEPTVEVRTTGGKVVGVGDVIDVGTRSGRTCTFADGVGVVMTTISGGAGARLRIDGSCRVIVAAIQPVSGELSPSPLGWTREPKHPDDVPDTVPSARGAVSAQIATASMLEDPVLMWAGYVVETFSDAALRPQWQERIELDYSQDASTGAIVASAIGLHTDCAVVPIEPTGSSLYVNEVSNCVFRHTPTSGPYAQLVGSADYQQSLLGQVLAAVLAKDVFIVTETEYSGSCPLPRTAPTGWTITCDSWRDEVPA